MKYVDNVISWPILCPNCHAGITSADIDAGFCTQCAWEPNYRRFKNKQRFHRYRAEQALGHPLPKGAQVHHADLSKRDDAPLVICQDQKYHGLLHTRTRIIRAGGNPNTQRICSRCKKLRFIEEMAGKKREESRTCKLCLREDQKRRRLSVKV